MTCLTADVPLRPINSVLWYGADIEQITRERLAKLTAACRADTVRGKCVALAAMPAVEFVAALVWLDGLAKSLLVLPSEEDAVANVARLAEAGVDTVLNAGWLGPTTPDGTPDTWNSSADASFPPLGGVKAADRIYATSWLLPTSGTTGTPKLIGHDFVRLTQSLSRRSADPTVIWGCLYSLRRFAGLQVFLQAWIAGMPLVLRDDDEALSVTLARLRKRGCTALSATPSMWRKLAMTPGFDELRLRQVTLGGEIVDQAILELLKYSFPAARITHIYASTEAGVGFAVHDGLAGFPKAYLHEPPGRMQMKINAPGHLCFAALPGGPNLAGAADAMEWHDSGDVVRADGDRVYFLGRANGSINVGGNKVMPEEVEAVIKEMPQVAFVQVRAKSSGIMGNLVEACVVLQSATVLDAAFKKALIAHCRNRLEGFKVPAFVTQTDEIELTATGKLSRRDKA